MIIDITFTALVMLIIAAMWGIFALVKSAIRQKREYQQAVRLLHALNQGRYRQLTPAPTLSGVLDQIDHITAPLIRKVYQ